MSANHTFASKTSLTPTTSRAAAGPAQAALGEGRRAEARETRERSHGAGSGASRPAPWKRSLKQRRRGPASQRHGHRVDHEGSALAVPGLTMEAMKPAGIDLRARTSMPQVDDDDSSARRAPRPRGVSVAAEIRSVLTVHADPGTCDHLGRGHRRAVVASVGATTRGPGRHPPQADAVCRRRRRSAAL